MVLPTYTPVHNWRGEPNKSNRYKVHIRITIPETGGNDSRYYEIEAPIKVHTDEWSGKHLTWVKNTNPYHFEINNKIKETLDLLTELNKRYYVARKELTFTLVFTELNMNFNRAIFNEYYAVICKMPKEKLQPDTIKRYKSALAALNKFNPQIHFHELEEPLFVAVKKHLLADQDLDDSTVRGYFNAYSKIIYWSRLDNYITREHEDRIFGKISLKKDRPAKDHLEEDEILQWKNADCSGKYKSLARERDIFMIMIYCGIYYSDFKTMLKTELKRDPEYGHYLSGERYKNENLALIPLWVFPDAMPLMQNYMSKDPEDPLLFDKKYFMESDQGFNKRLKTIAKDILKWQRNMTNKLARFSNTQLFIRYGANVPIVAKIRGHQDDATTKAYFDVNIREVAEATKGMNFKELLGI